MDQQLPKRIKGCCQLLAITVDPRLSGPRLSGTSIIGHHFRVNLLIDFAVLLIALISSHVYFSLQLHFLTSSCIFLTSEYAAVPS